MLRLVQWLDGRSGRANAPNRTARHGRRLDAAEVAHAAAANHLAAGKRDNLVQCLIAAAWTEIPFASAHFPHRVLPRPADVVAARALAKTSLIVKGSPAAMRTRGSRWHGTPSW